MAALIDKKIFFIINPHSGGKNSLQWWEQTQPLLDQRGYDYFWQYTNDGGIDDQVRAAVCEEGAEAVIAVGGDGTFSHALNGIIDNDALVKEDIVFVAAPLGTSCDFPRSLYANHKQDLLELLEEGVVRNIDIGRGCFIDDKGNEIGIKYFLNSFDAGVGADICYAVNANQGRLKKIFKSGRLAFMFAAIRELLRFEYTVTEVETEDETIRGEYIIIGFGNGVYAGGGMKLFPGARLDDAKLDLLLIPRKSRPDTLRLFAKVYTGKIRDIKGVIYRHLKSVSIKTERPIFVEMDGEVPGSTDLSLRVCPKFLPLLVFEDTLD